MELTKEKCEEALDDIIVNCCCMIRKCVKDNKCRYNDSKLMCESYEDYKKLQQLINEHFDNQPLKFEELHEGMWVWDNKHKVYNKIRETYNFNGTAEVVAFVYLNLTIQWNCSVKFEENRFYRKEVKDVDLQP